MSTEITVTEERAREVLGDCWNSGFAYGAVVGIIFTFAFCIAIYVWRIYPLICQ